MEDRWDFKEVEIKVLPDGRFPRLLELTELAAPPGAKIVRKPHVAFFDLYFDTPSLAFYENGIYLRARFSKTSFRRKGTYKVFFKENGKAPAGAQFVSRREVRTDLTRDELLLFSSGRMPGVASELAYALLDRIGESRVLAPICVVSSFRRYFTMRSPDPSLPDFLNLSIEQSTAFAARDLDLDLLIRQGFIDAPRSSSTYDFELSEAELTVEGVEAAEAMFKRLVAAFAGEFELITGSKYHACIAQLGLNRAGRRQAPFSHDPLYE